MAGNKNSGRKTDGEIVAKYINANLANQIGNEELKRIKGEKKRRREDLKEIVMPIVLKDMTEKKDIDIRLPIPLLKGLTDVYPDQSADKVAGAEKEN